MLFVVGDSNSLGTAEFFLRDSDTSLGKRGWTTEQILQAVRKANDLSRASAFFVFAGMNDRLPGEQLASQVLQIVAVLRARRRSPSVPIFVALPFCVQEATPAALCRDRATAARLLARELSTDCIVVAPHVTRDRTVRRAFVTTKPGSAQPDPLHLHPVGYMHIANVVNEHLSTHAERAKRSPKPNRRYGV